MSPPLRLGLRDRGLWKRQEHVNASQTGLDSSPAPSLPHWGPFKACFLVDRMEITVGPADGLNEMPGLSPGPAHSRSLMIADCPPPPSPNAFTHWVTLRKLLPSQGPSEGPSGAPSGDQAPAPAQGGTCMLAPVEGVLLQETLEDRQGRQTAAGVK